MDGFRQLMVRTVASGNERRLSREPTDHIQPAWSPQGRLAFVRASSARSTLEPNDLSALTGQGEALVERGAVERAKQNLARIKSVCKAACPQAQTLASVIAKGPPPQIVTAQAPEPASPATKN